MHLQLQHTELFLAAVELMDVRSFEHHLAERRSPAPGQSKQGQRPTDRTGNRRRKKQTGQHKHHAHDKHRSEPDQYADRQQLSIHKRPAPLLQFDLVAAKLVEPLVELHTAAELRDQPTRAIHRLGQIAHATRGQLRGDLCGKRVNVLLRGRRGLPGFLQSRTTLPQQPGGRPKRR